MTCRKTEEQNFLDLTFVSENEHNTENVSNRATLQLNESYSQSLLNGKLKATQMDIICRDSLELKQSESFLSGLNDSIPKNGYESTNGIKDESKKDLCTEFDSKHEHASTSEEFSHSTPSRQERKNGSKKRKLRKCKVEDSNCCNGSNVDGSDSEILDMSDIKSPHKRRKKNTKNVTSNGLNVDGSDSEILDMSDIKSPHKRRKNNSKNVTSNGSNVDGSDSEILDMSDINSPHKRRKMNSNNVTSENLVKKNEKQDTQIKLNSGTSAINGLDSNEGNQQYQPQKKNKRKRKYGESSNCSNVSDVNGSYTEIHIDSDILLKASPKKEKSNKARNFESSNQLNNIENNTQEANESSVKHGTDSTKLLQSSIDVCGANTKIKKEKKNVLRRKSKVNTSERHSSPSLNKSESDTSLHLKTPIKKVKTELNVSAQSEEVEVSCDIFDETFSGQATSKDATEEDMRVSFSESDEISIDIKEHGVTGNVSSSSPDIALEMFCREKELDVNFKVSKLHQIVDRASKPTQSQRVCLANKGIQMKQGKFNRSEDKQIRENWNNFIQVYGIKDNPCSFFCLDKKRITAAAKKIFLFYLARDMPERTLYCVFKRFKTIMSGLSKGRFSKEEDNYIEKVMQAEGETTSVTEIAKRLNRSLLAVSTHMSKLRNAHTRKIKWRGKNAASFIKYLLKVTKISEQNIDQLKNRKISIEEWYKLSKKLDGIPVRVLKPVWLCRLHPRLFIPGSSCDLSQIKMKLVESLYKNGETNWLSVDWNQYVQQFEGFTSLRLYLIMKRLVDSQVPEKKRNNLKKCLKYLMANKVHIIYQSSQILYKIKYANGEIEDMEPPAKKKKEV